jgi:hypothetical protein
MEGPEDVGATPATGLGGVVCGRWFLADPSTRTISPFSKITVPQYTENRIKENTAESLAEAKPLAFGNPDLLERILKAQAALASAKGAAAAKSGGKD